MEYTIRRSKKAKNIRLTVDAKAGVILTLPRWVPKGVGERFLRSKEEWIGKQLKRQRRRLKKTRVYTREDYLNNKEKARIFIKERLDHFNSFYGFDYKRIAIRDTKTRWGSCSDKGNLNFSYKLLFLPKEQADYVIVHELCHLKEMNHSPGFWDLVSKAVPDYKSIRKKIRHCL